MARGDFKQRVVFEVEDQGSAEVDRIQGRFSKLGSFLASRFTVTLGDVVSLFRGVAGAVSSVVEAANTQEAAVQSLDKALSSLGPSAENVSKQLQDQAAALEATTKFSDEAIIKNQALALNLGVSADQAGKLTQAAVELSAATGSSLESSFVNLSRTLNGFRGELGELVPEVAGMSEEALRSGAALDVVIDRLGGTAQAEVRTFAGLLTQLSNAWGTVVEKVGAAITENEGVRESLERVKNLITSPRFLEAIEEVAQGFADIVGGIIDLSLKGDAALQTLRSLRDRFNELKESILSALGPFRAFGEFIVEGFTKQATAGIQLWKNLGTAAEFVAEKTGIADEFNRRYTEGLEGTNRVSEQYEAQTYAVAAAVTQRNETETVTVETVNNLGTETEQATEALLSYEEANRQVRAEADDLTRSLERTARAAAQVNSATGGSLTARDRRSQADVDAALRAGRTPFMGGTRIRTADGSGSRLLR